MIAPTCRLAPDPNAWIEEHFEALEPVVEYHANRLARTHRAFRQEHPAIANELWLELVRKSARYRADKASPQTFAKIICQRKISTLLRALNARRRGPGTTQEFSAFNPESRIETNLDESTKGRHRGCASDDHRDLAFDVREICERLPPRLRPLAQQLQTMSPTEAAKNLRLSPEELADQLEAIRKRFQRADLDQYHGSPA